MTMTVAMAKPVLIQVISWTLAPTAERICESATFTIDTSIAPMSVPNVTENATSHLRREAGVAAGAAAGAGARAIAPDGAAVLAVLI